MQELDDYSRDYLQLIEEVAEDGELTYQEIYRLAKWLNDNPQGRKSWPAYIFMPLLKQCFADKKIDAGEALAIAKLIQLVRREWARMHVPPASNQPVDYVSDAIAAFDARLAELPSIPLRFEVESMSEMGTVYVVDLSSPQCECPDFRSYRARLPALHLSRCCKHIMQAYAEVRPANGWPYWLDAFLESGFRPHPDQNWQVYSSQIGTYLVSSACPSWGNVYTIINGKSEKYGYSIDEERWSYGKQPEEAKVLARIVYSLS